MKRQAGMEDDEDEDEEDDEMLPENEAEPDDEETAMTVENLRVFCVSAVEYLKLQGKLPMDGNAQVCVVLTLKLPGPCAGMGGSLTVTVA